jgi:hypothetical protein
MLVGVPDGRAAKKGDRQVPYFSPTVTVGCVATLRL